MANHIVAIPSPAKDTNAPAKKVEWEEPVYGEHLDGDCCVAFWCPCIIVQTINEEAQWKEGSTRVYQVGFWWMLYLLVGVVARLLDLVGFEYGILIGVFDFVPWFVLAFILIWWRNDVGRFLDISPRPRAYCGDVCCMCWCRCFVLPQHKKLVKHVMQQRNGQQMGFSPIGLQPSGTGPVGLPVVASGEGQVTTVGQPVPNPPATPSAKEM